MEFALTRKAIEAEKRYESAPRQTHIRAEAMVAGAGREMIDILLTDAKISIKSHETQTDRVLMEGECVCQAAYRAGNETNARAANASAPVSFQFDLPGALSGMTNTVSVQIDEVNAKSENGHIVFDVYATLRACATSLVPVDVIVGVGDDQTLETRFEDIKSVKLSAENAVTEHLAQTVALPAALDARYVLMDWAKPNQIDYQKEPGGVRVTGNVLVETLISTGIAQKPVQLVKYRLPVDKFVEMPEWLLDNVKTDVNVMDVKTYINQGAGGEDATLNMEAEAEICVLATGEDNARALTDVFSTGDYLVGADKKTYEVCLGAGRLNMQEPFRASVLLKDGAGAVGEVCAVKAHATVGEVIPDGAKTVVMGVVNVQVIYMTGNGEKLLGERQDLPFEINVAAEIDKDALVTVTALSPEGNALMSDRIEVKCMLDVTMDQRTKGEMTIIKDVFENGEAPAKKGIMIVWPGETDDEWTIAKRYLTRVENVRNAYDGTDIRQNPLVLRL